MLSLVRIGVIIPTLNAAQDWPRLVPVLLRSIDPGSVLVVDSSSDDQTVKLAREAGFLVHTITRAEFNHGATRQLAADLLPDAEILVYLTQDAVLLEPDAIRRLTAVFADAAVAAAYGRQLPRPEARPIEAHAREFNYPAISAVRDFEDRHRFGIKTIFVSNSFAAYRRSALLEVGGFPGDVIFGEDTVTVGRLLINGWKIAYVAEAQVYHSHAYTWMQDFRRYFDIGVLHTRERWLQESFGQAGGEGKRFVISEVKSLWRSSPWLIPSALVRTGLKLLGYRLGRVEDRLSPALKRRLSMHRGFWTSI